MGQRSSILKRGDGRALDAFAELGDALGGVGALFIMVQAAKLVATQTASNIRGVLRGNGGGVSGGLEAVFAVRL